MLVYTHIRRRRGTGILAKGCHWLCRQSQGHTLDDLVSATQPLSVSPAPPNSHTPNSFWSPVAQAVPVASKMLVFLIVRNRYPIERDRRRSVQYASLMILGCKSCVYPNRHSPSGLHAFQGVALSATCLAVSLAAATVQAADVTVNITDSGTGSLRQAIATSMLLVRERIRSTLTTTLACSRLPIL